MVTAKRDRHGLVVPIGYATGRIEKAATEVAADLLSEGSLRVFRHRDNVHSAIHVDRLARNT